ncbi:hypothetical protein GQR58_017819 [Nymphon striatum]|nr:hypothetical protein GQR58_017819 [Nymphon striatum]
MKVKVKQTSYNNNNVGSKTKILMHLLVRKYLCAIQIPSCNLLVMCVDLVRRQKRWAHHFQSKIQTVKDSDDLEKKIHRSVPENVFVTLAPMSSKVQFANSYKESRPHNFIYAL